MKTYKSQTANHGTTIELDSVKDAIAAGEKALQEPDKWIQAHYWYKSKKDWFDDYKDKWNRCISAIQHGDEQFGAKCADLIDKLLDLVDMIEPTFSMMKQGYERAGEDMEETTSDLLQSDSEKQGFKRKFHKAEKMIKPGKGEGAYRIIINTDVWWGGSHLDNAAMIGALIELLQRFAPVEVWIQQGWLGGSPKDGVTLFKLDYSLSLDLTSLTFWINHEYKDSVFSYLVNKGLERQNTGTSQCAEIDCDLMMRGDWQNVLGFNEAIADMMFTEKQDKVAAWIAHTGYKILYGEDAIPPFTIKDPDDEN